jgi:crotonobetainyl-CoA:carnitine CoA-transferase CaiB-like acyl-CoA transferase
VTWSIDPKNSGTGLPLEGVRILDFSRVLAGPLCAMIAGDLGADVIKVESPDGDPVRALAPPLLGDDATYYLSVNRHRRNVIADLRDPDDYARVLDLLGQADAVVENFLPSQVQRLGIDRLRAANPNCVWVSITPATSGGPIADLPAFDLLAQARSGLMGITGEANGQPTKVGAPVADVVTGLYGAIGLLAGLFARLNGRAGRHFEAPLLESTMSALINQAQGYLSTGVNPQRLGNDHPSIAPYGPVTTSDGFLLVAVGTDAQFAKLVNVLGVPELTAHSKWSTNKERVASLNTLRTLLDQIFALHPTSYWLEQLDQSGVPHAPILDVEGAFDQEQIRDGDFLGVMDTPHGETAAMQTPLLIDGVRPAIRSGPRKLGEDTREIFGVSSSD